MATTDNEAREVQSQGTGHKQLKGWKEIASYAKRGTRTVQRWQQKGFPVHRHVTLGTVCAYRSEIDAWLKSANDESTSSSSLDLSSGSGIGDVASGPRRAATSASIGTGVAEADQSNSAHSTIHAAGRRHHGLVWAGLVLTTVIVFALAIFTVAYRFTIFTFWLGAVIVILGYMHLKDTPIVRAFVAGYFITAMSYTSSASTLPDVLATVINLTTLPPSAVYSFAIGLKFIPLFILVLIYWVISGDKGILAYPRLGKRIPSLEFSFWWQLSFA